ncbi:hypothetical protein [Catenovulum maritimum]|uniref:hypothetical protein n=1 Tax=Catenovulum maritimum TaxID=1513271 RepID=UPI00069DBEB9|nr:hypothetical protein [Catenovulum maritimum]
MKLQSLIPYSFCLFSLILTGCNTEQDQQTQAVFSELKQALANQTYRPAKVMFNEAAYVPAQCYTKTQDEANNTYNPCYVCHANGKRPNYINGTDLQTEYGFTAEYLQTNRWKNLFRDFSKPIAAQSDQEITQYIRSSNYFNADNQITLAAELAKPNKNWDVNNNGKWDGYTPDVYFNFDAKGFDKTPNGQYTGWRVFAYAPFPGAFLPTNGSTDDVLIRLPEIYRQDKDKKFDLKVYELNLAIVESLLKEENIQIPSTDEALYQVDLNKDGKLNLASQIVYRWAPKQNIYMSYVGLANSLFDQQAIKMAAGLYPEGTEFLHTVRYIDHNDKGQMQMSARIKEVRHSIKTSWNTYAQLQNAALSEIKEKHDFPERLRQFSGNAETGLYTGFGWRYQGFIEDKIGKLRPQTYEETVACMGCHSGISATLDSSFAMPRKYNQDQFKLGWYHWSEKGLKALPEYQYSDGRGEYTTYLKHNPWGDEFRSNAQIFNKFNPVNESAKASLTAQIKQDISILLEPSQERALLLNKAYRAIVQEQSYIWGRQAVLNPAKNIHQFIESGTATGIETAILK